MLPLITGSGGGSWTVRTSTPTPRSTTAAAQSGGFTMCEAAPPPRQSRRVAQTRGQTRKRKCRAGLGLCAGCESRESDSPRGGSGTGPVPVAAAEADATSFEVRSDVAEIRPGPETDSRESQTRRPPASTTRPAPPAPMWAHVASRGRGRSHGPPAGVAPARGPWRRVSPHCPLTHTGRSL
jgi:hypothetical protein